MILSDKVVELSLILSFIWYGNRFFNKRRYVFPPNIPFLSFRLLEKKVETIFDRSASMINNNCKWKSD